MAAPDVPRVALLRLRAPVQFRDRWQGTVVAVEVDEDWEALNLVVKRGLVRWSHSVKLPFSALLSWSEHHARFDCTSRQAFAREIPPIAVPPRPLSPLTSISIPGAGLDGLLIDSTSRRVTGAIIALGGGEKVRIPVDDLSFDGKILHVADHGDEPEPYLSEEDLAERGREAVRQDRFLTGAERHYLSVEASEGVVTVKGNVHTKQTRDRLAAALRRLPSVSNLRLEVADDIGLELEIGQAIEKAGVQRGAEVYTRSALGRVTLFGRAPSSKAADDIVRAVSRVPGVRDVTSRLQVSAAPAAAR